MPRRKRQPLPDINHILEPIRERLAIKFFSLKEIPMAVAWAERGRIAIHENYHSKKKQSYHVISGRKENLLRFCREVGIAPDGIVASEFYKFWHLTWFLGEKEEKVCSEAG